MIIITIIFMMKVMIIKKINEWQKLQTHVVIRTIMKTIMREIMKILDININDDNSDNNN